MVERAAPCSSIKLLSSVRIPPDSPSVARHVKKMLGIVEDFSNLFPRIERYDGAGEGFCTFWCSKTTSAPRGWRRVLASAQGLVAALGAHCGGKRPSAWGDGQRLPTHSGEVASAAKKGSSMGAPDTNYARYRANWQDEIESAALYAALAEVEQQPGLANVYRRL